MKCRRYATWWVTVAVGLCVLLMAMPSAWADDAGASESQLAELGEQLESLQEDIGDDGQEELDKAKGWLEEAKQLDARGARSGVEQRIRRIDHKIDLLRVLSDTRELQATIESQHQAYETSKEQLERMRSELEDLERQKEERQNELEQIRGEE